jgi:hypothetical protein
MLDLPKILMEQCRQNTRAGPKKHTQDSALEKSHKHSACFKTGQVTLQIRAKGNHRVKRNQTNSIITDPFPKDHCKEIRILLSVNQCQRGNSVRTNQDDRNVNDVTKIPIVTIHNILTIKYTPNPVVQINHNRYPNANKQDCSKEPEPDNIPDIFEEEFFAHCETFF